MFAVKRRKSDKWQNRGTNWQNRILAANTVECLSPDGRCGLASCPRYVGDLLGGRKTTAVGVINHGHRCGKPWRWKFITMAMEIYNHGQRNIHEWPSFFQVSTPRDVSSHIPWMEGRNRGARDSSRAWSVRALTGYTYLYCRSRGCGWPCCRPFGRGSRG